MAKFQSLGLSDDGERKPAGKGGESQQPQGSPSQPSAPSPKADDAPASATPNAAPPDSPSPSGLESEVPEWDALVDALTPSEPAETADWHPKPWVPPPPGATPTPDWDVIGEPDQESVLSTSPPHRCRPR